MRKQISTRLSSINKPIAPAAEHTEAMGKGGKGGKGGGQEDVSQAFVSADIDFFCDGALFLYRKKLPPVPKGATRRQEERRKEPRAARKVGVFFLLCLFLFVHNLEIPESIFQVAKNDGQLRRCVISTNNLLFSAILHCLIRCIDFKFV